MSAKKVVTALLLIGVLVELHAYNQQALKLHGFGFGLFFGALQSRRVAAIWEKTNKEQRQQAQALVEQGVILALCLCIVVWGLLVPSLPRDGRDPFLFGYAGNFFVGTSAALWVVVGYLTPPSEKRRKRAPATIESDN